jgi:hypothetical protein
MELKNVNPNGGIVVASNMINFNFFFLKIVKIELKNEDHILFFLNDTMIARRKKYSSYLSPRKSTLNESKLSMSIWIYSTRKKNLIIFWKFFWCTCSCPED